MKKTIIAMLCLAVASGVYAKAPALRYTDATTLTTINRAQPDGPALQRLDTSKYPELTPKVKYFYGFPTGMAIRFRTNSRTIGARWTTNDSLNANNCTPIAQKGLDLYIKRDGKWIFAGVGRPKYTGTSHKGTIVQDMDTTMKECMLYLPLYSQLHSLEIGTDQGSTIEPATDTPRRKVVFLGSSLTHGIGANRPAMAYPALLGRRMDLDAPNLGASGLCKLEQFYAQVVCDTQADAFVFDTFSNPSAEMINERLMPFVETIRRCHPDTPLIFLQTEIRETSNFDTVKHEFENEKRAAAVEQMRRAMEKFNDIYFINPGFTLGSDHEATADGTHPSDLGTMRVAENLQPELEDILRRYF